jgi:hypothetical protein
VAGTCHIDVMPLSYRAGAFKKYPVRSRPRRRPIPSVAQFRRVRGAATRSISATKINRRESIFGKAGSIGFGAPRSSVPEFPVPALKRFALREASPDSNYVGNRTLCGRCSSAWRCAPPLSSARIHNVANLQADADLHTLSSHHRDAVHEMRRADAARTDRATRPQLQFADL